MTKETFNKILKKYQEAGVHVKIESNELLSQNYQQWQLKFQNGTRIVRTIVSHNIHNNEIGCRLKSGSRADIYRIGQLLGLKFVIEI